MPGLKELSLSLFGLGLLGAMLYAGADSDEKATNTKVAFSPPPRMQAPNPAAPIAAKDAGTFVFGAPPAGTYEEELRKYQPIATYLSLVTGKRFVYQYSDNWLTYSKNMAGGAYDVLFDGPAGNGWRVERMDHVPLVKLPSDIVYVVITRADTPIVQLKQLAGRRVCAVAAPDVGALTLMSQFDNPARQPVIAEAKDWRDAYKGLLEGRCVGGVVPQSTLGVIDRGTVRIIYQHKSLPNQAFSAGPRLSPELKDKIRDALLAAPGKEATAKLRAAHGGGDFVPATPADYAGLGKLLKDSLYYY